MYEEVTETMTIKEVARLIDWCRAKGLRDTDICDCLMYIATGANPPAQTAARPKDDEEGMTDLQYKGMLLDLREDWQRVRDLAAMGESAEVRKEVEKQIAKTKKKLEFLSQGEGSEQHD